MKKNIASMAVMIAFASVSIGAARADDMDHRMTYNHMMRHHMMHDHMMHEHMMHRHMMHHMMHEEHHDM